MALPWDDPAWLPEARAWIEAQLERLGKAAATGIEQTRVRPWSTVLRVPSGEGDAYFKAAAPALAHEPSLNELIARVRPDCVLPLLASDPERGWSLLPDGGPLLREVATSPEEALPHWERVLPLYAGLQLDLAPRGDELLERGVPGRGPRALPALLEELLADAEVRGPGGLTEDEHARLEALAPAFADACAELAALGAPDTVQHDDLHDGSVFVAEAGYRVFDWADACVGHPFSTLLVTLRSVAFRFELDEAAPELARLRDAYLEPWASLAARDALLRAVELARWTGMLPRALSWRAALRDAERPLEPDYAEAAPGWLRELMSAAR